MKIRVVALVAGLDGFQGHSPYIFPLTINTSVFSRLHISDVCSKPACQEDCRPSLLLTARMLSLYSFIALALSGLFSPVKTAPALHLTEFGDGFVTNDNSIITPFHPNYDNPINPYYTSTGPVLKAQIDDISLASGFEFNSATTEPVNLVQISDQGVVPNPDPGNWEGDPDIEAGNNCRKTKSLHCCKGQYNSRTQKVDQCMLCKLSLSLYPQFLVHTFVLTHLFIHIGRTENAIFCNHATYYCCHYLDVRFSNIYYSSLTCVE